MSEPGRSGIDTPQHWPAWVVIASFVVLSIAPFVDAPWRLALAGVAAIATWVTWRSDPATAHFGFAVTVLLAVLAIPGAWALWPAPLLAAIVGYLAVRRGQAGDEAHPIRRGRFDLRIGGLMVLFVIMSGAALVGWWLLVQPDLSFAVGRLPKVPVFVLILGGVAFAALNALGEEFVWRGFGTHALENAGVHVALAIAIQAVSFGLIHIHGFPHGWIGVGLATIYGAMMGVLRSVSDGLLVPWAAHVAADLVIFAVLLTVASA